MPPRYAYWTIIVDNQPTAFRSAAVDDLMPTFNRLRAKHPDAVLKWFQNGRLWDSQREAREAQERRGEQGRRFDPKQRPREARTPAGNLEWKPKGSGGDRPRPKLEWSPRPDSTSGSSDRRTRPHDARKPFRPKGQRPDDRRREQREKPWGGKPERPKLEWSPRPTSAKPPAERAHKAFKPDRRSEEPPRDSKWRPGGAHRDPRQKYKDAKKAKWTRFKETIRRRSSKPRKP